MQEAAFCFKAASVAVPPALTAFHGIAVIHLSP